MVRPSISAAFFKIGMKCITGKWEGGGGYALGSKDASPILAWRYFVSNFALRMAMQHGVGKYLVRLKCTYSNIEKTYLTQSQLYA